MKNKPRTLAESLDPKSGPVPNQNMGRVQKADPHWRDHGDSTEKEANYYRGAEWSDRQEREAYGRALPAAYRHILGPAPTLSPGDRVGARAYLQRIHRAVEQGGWTRSEWARLRKLKSKWTARATGTDPRFAEVGNRRGGVSKQETANVQMRQIVLDMKRDLDRSGRSNGD